MGRSVGFKTDLGYCLFDPCQVRCLLHAGYDEKVLAKYLLLDADDDDTVPWSSIWWIESCEQLGICDRKTSVVTQVKSKVVV